MPVIHIESLPLENHEKILNTIEILPNAVEDALGWPKGKVQAYFTAIEPFHYCFNGNPGSLCRKDQFHPMVHIYLKDDKPEDIVIKITETVADEISKGFEIDKENILIMINRYKEGSFYIKGKFI